MSSVTGRAQVLWGLRGLGPEAKLFVLALEQTEGDVHAAATLAELKPGQGDLFGSMLLELGYAQRPNGNGRLELTVEAMQAA